MDTGVPEIVTNHKEHQRVFYKRQRIKETNNSMIKTNYKLLCIKVTLIILLCFYT